MPYNVYLCMCVVLAENWCIRKGSIMCSAVVVNAEVEGKKCMKSKTCPNKQFQLFFGDFQFEINENCSCSTFFLPAAFLLFSPGENVNKSNCDVSFCFLFCLLRFKISKFRARDCNKSYHQFSI